VLKDISKVAKVPKISPPSAAPKEGGDKMTRHPADRDRDGEEEEPKHQRRRRPIPEDIRERDGRM